MSEPKPADAREREDQDLADFDIGFQAQLDGKVFDNTQSWAWCNGFNAALKDSPKVRKP